MTILGPLSPVSSYQLLLNCEKSVTFMSTIGVEATYWGKPSIILSNALYKGIGAVYEPKNIKELVGYIKFLGLQVKQKESALAYGAFIRCAAEKLNYSDSLDHCTLTFKGKRPNAHKKVLTSLWRFEYHMNRFRMPIFLKKTYQLIEWYRLRWITKGYLSD